MGVKLLHKLITRYLEVIFKLKSSDQVIDVFSTLRRARNILVCMPDRLEDFGIARKFMTTLRDNFAGAKITFVLRQKYLNLIDRTDNKDYEIIIITPEQISRAGLPTKPVGALIRESNFDLVIDFNHEFHLASTYLCILSGAPLRICIENKDREPFFNFRIRSRPGERLESKYKNFIKYLRINNVPMYSS